MNTKLLLSALLCLGLVACPPPTTIRVQLGGYAA